VKIEAPNFVALSDSELETFWRSHQVSDVRNLGDRLLAESLPRFAPRDSHYYPEDLSQRRQAIPMTVIQVAQQLGVTEALVMGWESGMMRPPASLAIIYEILKERIAAGSPDPDQK
jgi:DNA-binding transcriptional regulator YiaG